ncbi:hypothetical protein D3C77_362060 [compost metagenome]
MYVNPLEACSRIAQGIALADVVGAVETGAGGRAGLCFATEHLWRMGRVERLGIDQARLLFGDRRL